MAWNKYYIFVKAPELTDMGAILANLGLGHYQPVEEVPLHYSNKPETLFAGFYQGNLLLVHPDLPFHFFGEGQSETERLFITTFPGKEIAALIENSTVYMFGYAVLQAGRKVRMKDGADGEIDYDAGELLPEEQEVLAAAVSGKLTEAWRAEQVPNETAADLLARIQQQRITAYNKALKSAGKGKVKSRQPKDSDFVPTIVIDPDLPTGWAMTEVKDVADCLDYIRRPINREERQLRVGTIPYYGANGRTGWIDDHLFDEDLVVIVEDETFTGRELPFSYIIRGKSWVNNHAHVMRPVGGISADYLNACWSYYNFIPLTSGSTGRKKLTQGALMSAPFTLAPLAEQQEIVRQVNHYFELADQLEARFEQAVALVEQLPQALLAKAFSGQLVPQDPSDEPASELLAQLRTGCLGNR
jgi:hypothetical protein